MQQFAGACNVFFSFVRTRQASVLRRTLALCVLLCAGAFEGFATRYYWNHTGSDTNWSNYLNWSTEEDSYSNANQKVPEDADEVYVITTGETITLDTSPIISNMVLGATTNWTFDLELTLEGSGTLTTAGFDTANNRNFEVSISSETTMSITNTLFANMDSGKTLTFSGSGTLCIPACGANCEYGISAIQYTIANVKKIGSAHYYSMEFTNASNFPAQAISITITRDNTGGGRTDVYYPCTVNVVKTGTANFTLETVTYSTSGDNTYDYYTTETTSPLVIGSNVLSKTLTLSCSDSSGLEEGDGIEIKIWTPDKAFVLGIISFYEGKVTWTGAQSSTWLDLDNWSVALTSLDALATTDITITNSYNNAPVISVDATVQSLTVTSGALVTVEGGTFSVTNGLTLDTGNGDEMFTVSGGTLSTPAVSIADYAVLTHTGGTISTSYLETVAHGAYEQTGGVLEFTGTAGLSRANTAYSTFSTVEIASGAALTLDADLTLSGDWTNYGTVDTATNTAWIVLSGTSGQTFTGGTDASGSYYAVSVMNTTGTVTFNGTSSVKTLSVASGAKIALGNDETDSFTYTGTLLEVPSALGSLSVAGSVTCAGGISLAKDVSVTADATIASPLTLAADSEVSGSSTLTFASTVTGTHSLSAATPLVFRRPVSISALTATGSVALESSCSAITTSSGQTYNGPLTVSTAATLSTGTGEAVICNDSVTLEADVVFGSSDGSVYFYGEVGGGSGPQTITVNGNCVITSSVTVTGNQVYNGTFYASLPPSASTGTVTLTSSNTSSSITFAGNVAQNPSALGADLVLSAASVVFADDSAITAPVSFTKAGGTVSGSGLSVSDATFSGVATVSASGTFTLVTVNAPARFSASNTFVTAVFNADAELNDSNTFETLRALTGGVTLTMTGGTTQTVTSSLELEGETDAYLTLTSSGTWNLDCAGNTNLTPFMYLSVTNSAASNDMYVLVGTNGGGNTNWHFPEYDLDIVDAYTVYDDVLYLEFNDYLKNSGGEFTTLVSTSQSSVSDGGIWYKASDTVYAQFAGAYADADCTTTLPLDDLQTKVYLKTTGEKWNTDATGTSSGSSESTDRSGNHHSSLPALYMKKGIITSYDEFHLNADFETSAFSTVADCAAPVLIAVSSGQELHDSPDGTASVSDYTADSQKPYDAHNFIEFVYSEAVDVGSIPSHSDTASYPDYADILNIAATTYDGSSCVGGATSTSGSGLTVSGFATISAGSVTTGRTDSSSASPHALYRYFASSASSGVTEQTHRIRLSIAGFVSDTVSTSGKSYYSWPGYITSAVTPSGTAVAVSNTLIRDLSEAAAGTNALDASGSQNHPLPALTVNASHPAAPSSAEQTSTADFVYGSWDTTAPDFAPFRTVRNPTEWETFADRSETSNQFECAGSASADSTTVQWMEFHMVDNNPTYTSSDAWHWFSRVGWCNADDYTAVTGKAADSFGGARPFADDTSSRTSGGIRYSTLYSSCGAFSYVADDGITASFPDEAIGAGAASLLFTAAESPSNPTGSEDGLYFTIQMGTTDFPLRQQFTVTFNSSAAHITDLAGNLLSEGRSFTSIDLVPPKFCVSVAPIMDESSSLYKKLYVVFSKQLETGTILWYPGDGSEQSLDALSVIPQGLELISTDNTATASSIAIDETVPAQVVFSNSSGTGLILTLNQAVTLDDIKNVYVRIKDIGTSTDPLIGTANTHVSYIQDKNGNSMTLYAAHPLSDFAVNAVMMNYATSEQDGAIVTDQDGMAVESGLYEEGSWAVHEWGSDQGNYGTLTFGYDIFMNASLNDGTGTAFGIENLAVHLDNSPDSASVSTTYNKRSGDSWRIWLPNVTSDVFEWFAPANNKEFCTESGNLTEDASGSVTATFSIPVSSDSRYEDYKASDTVTFLFGLLDSAGNPVTIKHNPIYDNGTYTGTDFPLYSLRLAEDTFSALDLWSIRLKSRKTQRGGVTILNNVINATSGEHTLLEVTMPSSGTLNVYVLTADGNIVRRLVHGSVSEGSHTYRWDGTNNAGKPIARGIYFIRVTGSGIDETRKVMVVKE